LHLQSGNINYQIIIILLTININREHEIFLANESSDTEIQQRLLFLFQNDMLPSTKANILRIKVEKDYYKRKVIKLKYKIIGWIYVLSIGAFMLFYIFLFSVQKSGVNQKAWMFTFLINVMMDFFIISTTMVIIMEVLIPSAISRDLNQLKKQIATEMDLSDERKSQQQKEGLKIDFNAAHYFFVSVRLAKLYKHFNISKFILKYN
jgi:hypothetical protein